MALDLVTPFTKVQLEEEIKDTGRKQVIRWKFQSCSQCPPGCCRPGASAVRSR